MYIKKPYAPDRLKQRITSEEYYDLSYVDRGHYRQESDTSIIFDLSSLGSSTSSVDDISDIFGSSSSSSDDSSFGGFGGGDGGGGGASGDW